MKTIIISLVSILLTICFTGCKDDFGTPEGSVPSANASSIQVKFKTNASPILKNGEDDNEPDPMFGITGVVTQNGDPVQAEVKLMSMPQSTQVDSTNTNSDGGFEFYQVPSGSYNVIVVVGGGVAEIIEINL